MTFLTSHERARRSHIPHLGEVSQIERHKSVVISPRGRFHDLFQGINLVERQGRGKSSELSCLEIGVGYVRDVLILNRRVGLLDQLPDPPRHRLFGDISDVPMFKST